MINSKDLGPTAVSRLAALPRAYKQAIMIGLDTFLFVVSVFLSFYLRLGSFGFIQPYFFAFLALNMLIWPIIFWQAGLYKSIFRFVGVGLMSSIFRSYLIFALINLVAFGFIGLEGVPRTVSVIQPLVFFVFVVGIRAIVGFILVDLMNGKTATADLRVALIYGAGTIGQQLTQSLRAERQVRVVGYLDDDERLAGQKLDGMRIYDASDLGAVLERTEADMVLLALPSINRSERRRIVERLSAFPVEVRHLPRISELIEGQISIDEIRPVEIEDLLGREPVAANEMLMSRTISNKRVLVTGAGGSIGSELCRQIILRRPTAIVLAEMSESALYGIDRELLALREAEGLEFEIHTELVNVANASSTDRMFAKYKPDTVFHAAAYKHVPLVEANILGGLYNNIYGTKACAEAALTHGASHFILVSTDKAVRPTNVMGASKRVCELLLQGLSRESANTCFTMVRFGNVLGSSGSVVPQFLDQIRKGGPVTLTHRDITRFFMTIPEAAQLVIQAGGMAEGGEVFLLDMGKPIKIFDLARTMIRLSGLTVRDEANPEGDIELVEIGLRPGEKLYEELLIDSKSERTSHPRIMRGNEQSLPIDQLRTELVKLQVAIDTGNREDALSILRRLVPEFEYKGVGDTIPLRNEPERNAQLHSSRSRNLVTRFPDGRFA